MKFAIIAAGEGSRLKEEGVLEDKPLVCLNGEPLLCRLVRIFTTLGASEIVTIINESMPAVVSCAQSLKREHERRGLCPLTIVVKSTPSSMHSFYEMNSFLQDEPFCLTTIDTVFKEKEFSDYLHAFQSFGGDALMAVTPFVDDEKPLYVATDDDMNITGFHDEDCGCQFISGGIYGFKPRVLSTLHQCVERGQMRMRNFQRQLVADGLHLKAHVIHKILDIDHKEDILKAMIFLKEEL